MSGLLEDITLEIERSIESFGLPDQVYPTSLIYSYRTSYFRYIKLKEYPHLHNFAITHEGVLFKVKPLRVKMYEDGPGIDYNYRVPIMEDNRYGTEFFAIPNWLISPYLPRNDQCVVKVLPLVLETFFGFKITNPLLEKMILHRPDDFRLTDILIGDSFIINPNGYSEFCLPDC